MKKVFFSDSELGFLKEAGFSCYEDFMSPSFSTLIRSEGVDKRQTYRLVIPSSSGEKTYYLKVNRRERPRNVYKPLLWLRPPRNEAVREKLHIDYMKRYGFDVMNVAAWGYVTNPWVYASEGFVLLEGVEGTPFDEYVMKASKHQIQAAMKLLGRLNAKYHKAGFYRPLRVQDTIAKLDENNNVLSHVIIDRDNNRWWNGAYSRAQSVKALARSIQRTQRVTPLPIAGYLSLFQGYAEEAGFSREKKRRFLSDVISLIEVMGWNRLG